MKEKWISIVRLFWISKSRRFMVAAPTVTAQDEREKHFCNYVRYSSILMVFFFLAFIYIDINSKHTLIKSKTDKQRNETRNNFGGGRCE